MLCPALHYLMAEGGGKLCRLLQHLAYFGCCLRNAPTSACLSSSAFCSSKWGSQNCSLCKAGVLEQTLKKKCWFAGCRYAQVCLIICCLISKVFSTARNKSQRDPCFSLLPAQFSCQWNRKTSPLLILPLHRSDSITVGFLFPSADSCWSLWPLLSGLSGIGWILLFIVCFVVVSLVLKDFITADSVFYREQVIQSQNAVPFFLLPYLPLLLVLFRGIINCCCLCASTQSYRFSITKALYQRMWYQRKDFSFYR